MNSYHIRCDTCKQTSSTKNNLWKHIRWLHLYPDKSICDHCGAEFTSGTSFIKHVKKHSDGKEVLQCNECIQTYSRRQQLANHYNSAHRNSSSGYSCDTCGKSMVDKRDLRCHAFNHHNIWDRKPTESMEKLKCDECWISISNPGNMARHLKLHFPRKEKQFHCNICSKTFAYSKGLARHSKRHDSKEFLKEKFWCNICERKMSQKSDLAIHLESVHAMFKSERAFCDSCHEAISYRRRFKSHIVGGDCEKI